MEIQAESSAKVTDWQFSFSLDNGDLKQKTQKMLEEARASVNNDNKKNESKDEFVQGEISLTATYGYVSLGGCQVIGGLERT